MFTEKMSYSEALKVISDAYATKTKEEADRIYEDYQEFSARILRHELESKDTLTSYSYS